MKKWFLLLALIFSCYSFCNGHSNTRKFTPGCIYYDVLFLDKYNIKDSVLKILNYYNIRSQKDFTSNKFLLQSSIDRNYLPGFSTDSIIKEFNVSNAISSSMKGIGGIDVTNFSQGLSSFLIERAKDELNLAFFQRLKSLFNNEKYPELKILFPCTTDKIVNLLEYNYLEMLPILQKAFYQDIKQLPENMIQVLLLPKYYPETSKLPELFIILNSFNLIRQIDTLSPAQIIDRLPAIDTNNVMHLNLTSIQKKQILNLQNSLELIKIFSNSVRIDSSKEKSENYWVSSKLVYQNILNNPNRLNIFLGLLYQVIKSKPIAFNGDKLADSMKANNGEIWWYRMQLSKLLSFTETINESAKEIKRLIKDHQKPTQQNIHDYLGTTIDLTEFGLDVINHYYDWSKSKNDYMQYFTLAREVNNLYLNTVSEHYALAIHNALNIFVDFMNIQDTTGKKIPVIASRTLNTLTTVGTFIANMADATTPDQVKAAIEAAALPVGSSSFKKYHRWNLNLNGYLGANYNFTHTSYAVNNWDRAFNLAAPVGLNLSFFSLQQGGSFSLFVPVIDIGAIVDYQLTTTNQIEQKIYLSNIWTTGAYIVYGFGANLPLALGLGAQYGPGLVKVGNDINNLSWRVNVFLTFDIPIINLYHGVRKNIQKKGKN
jgi:hypothetical protein